MKYIIALDQGTTSSRAVIYDGDNKIAAMAQKEFPQIYPQPGWVEQDPMDIWASQYSVIAEAMAKSSIPIGAVEALGITNQRETTILWDKRSGEPVYNAIVWQCRRTMGICEELIRNGHAEYISKVTGLPVDAYFSGTKIKWILDHVAGARQLAEAGNLLFGTVDTWLIWKLTRGRVHATDATNASRTMLYNIYEEKWDETLLDILDIPRSILPEVKQSVDYFGDSDLFGSSIPILGVAGDQQAALFGQGCVHKGDVKNTYGTGCFLLMNTGSEPVRSRNGLITTIASKIGGKTSYALEGSVFTGGAIIQWLRDSLRLIQDARDSEYFAAKAKTNGGVYIVPAFTGLGAPHWDMKARGTIFGMTRGTNRDHIIRAALESIAYQTHDVLKIMEAETKLAIKDLKVDGGASANNFLMQFQADILNIAIKRPQIIETTSLGVFSMAALNRGWYKDTDELADAVRVDHIFQSEMEKATRQAYLKKWHKAVQRSLDWEE